MTAISMLRFTREHLALDWRTLRTGPQKCHPHVVFTSVPSPLKDKMDKRDSIPATLPLRYYKIENRLSYGPNLKIINLRDQTSHNSVSVPFKIK